MQRSNNRANTHRRWLRKKQEFSRPYMTEYYTDRNISWSSSRGAAESIDGAIQATVKRLAARQYRKAKILDRRTGELICLLQKLPTGTIAIHWEEAYAAYR